MYYVIFIAVNFEQNVSPYSLGTNLISFFPSVFTTVDIKIRQYQGRAANKRFEIDVWQY